MTDNGEHSSLPERLRQLARGVKNGVVPSAEILNEAAAEVQRLRALDQSERTLIIDERLTCECGAKLTVCASCAVDEYQARRRALDRPRTKEDDLTRVEPLPAGADGQDLPQSSNQQQSPIAPDDVMDVYVPGNWTCPKCDFVLSQATLFMQSGDIGCSRDQVMRMDGEFCPNDGEPMRRTTWRERAADNQKWSESLMEEIIALTRATCLPDAIDNIRHWAHDIHAYRGALGYSVPGWHDGLTLNGETPKCGLCDARRLRDSEAAARPPQAEAGLPNIAKRIIEQLWCEIPLYRKAQMMAEGFALDPFYAALDRERAAPPVESINDVCAMCGHYRATHGLDGCDGWMPSGAVWYACRCQGFQSREPAVSLRASQEHALTDDNDDVARVEPGATIPPTGSTAKSATGDK